MKNDSLLIALKSSVKIIFSNVSHSSEFPIKDVRENSPLKDDELVMSEM